MLFKTSGPIAPISGRSQEFILATFRIETAARRIEFTQDNCENFQGTRLLRVWGGTSVTAVALAAQDRGSWSTRNYPTGSHPTAKTCVDSLADIGCAHESLRSVCDNVPSTGRSPSSTSTCRSTGHSCDSDTRRACRLSFFGRAVNRIGHHAAIWLDRADCLPQSSNLSHAMVLEAHKDRVGLFRVHDLRDRCY